MENNDKIRHRFEIKISLKTCRSRTTSGRQLLKKLDTRVSSKCQLLDKVFGPFLP